jgi:hypothetical protein
MYCNALQHARKERIMLDNRKGFVRIEDVTHKPCPAARLLPLRCSTPAWSASCWLLTVVFTLGDLEHVM